MNNIKEFNNNPISRNEFWRISGPLCAGITLLAVMVVLWGWAMAQLRQDNKAKLRKKVDAILSQEKEPKTRKWGWSSRGVGKKPDQIV